MRTTAILAFFPLLTAGCGYTQVDWSAITPPPDKPLYIYNDSSEVPFAYKKMGIITESIYWQSIHVDRNPNEYEKDVLLSRLKTEARYNGADGLMNVRFFSKKVFPSYQTRTIGRSGYIYYAAGEATMIRVLVSNLRH